MLLTAASDRTGNNLLDRLTGGLRPYLILSLLCWVLFLPGLAGLPAMDRDESRFIQATRQMLETGDYVRIQFQDEMRAKKPAGVYWLQAAAVRALSHAKSIQIWPYRLPSFLAAWAAVLLTFAFGRGLFGVRPALLGAGILACSLMLTMEAHQGKSDAVLLVCAVAAQGVMMRFYVAGRARAMAAGSGGGGCSSGGCGSGGGTPLPGGPGTVEALTFWLAQGAAILVKGPVLPAISLLTLLALAAADRNLRWFGAMRPILGTVVAAAVATPWFVAISQATGGAFVGEAVKGDLLPKLLGAQESHGGLPGLYLLLASATFWPGSLILWPALATVWRERHRLAYRALLAWAVPAWIMFELIPTKLPHYVLPLYPALALIAAALVCEGAPAFQSRAARLWYGVWTVFGLGLAAAMVILPMRWGGGFDPVSVPAAIGLILATALPTVLAWRGRMVTAALALVLPAVAVYPVMFQHVAPSLDRLFVSRGVAQVVGTIGSDGPVAVAGYSEPSLVFLLGTDTKLVDGGRAAAYLHDHPRTLAVISDRERQAFDAQAQTLGMAVDEFGTVDGFNYSRGKPVRLTVYGVRSTP